MEGNIKITPDKDGKGGTIKFRYGKGYRSSKGKSLIRVTSSGFMAFGAKEDGMALTLTIVESKKGVDYTKFAAKGE